MNENHIEIIKQYNASFEIIKRFAGGMSNYTYHVKDENDNQFVFRIKGENGELFVNYENEQANLKLVDTLGINSKTIMTDPDSGMKIGEYIDGEMVHQAIDYQKVSDTLKHLHKSGIVFDNDYDPLMRLQDYENTHVKDSEMYNDLKDEFIKIYNDRLKHKDLFPCHNDAQIANFILGNDGKYYLLDWEFAGNNDPIYDIASFGNKDFNQAIQLLYHYYPNHFLDDVLDLYAWRFFQCLQWYNVAQAKHDLGMSEKLNINFHDVALMYLDKASTLLSEYNNLQE